MQKEKSIEELMDEARAKFVCKCGNIGLKQVDTIVGKLDQCEKCETKYAMTVQVQATEVKLGKTSNA